MIRFILEFDYLASFFYVCFFIFFFWKIFYNSVRERLFYRKSSSNRQFPRMVSGKQFCLIEWFWEVIFLIFSNGFLDNGENPGTFTRRRFVIFCCNSVISFQTNVPEVLTYRTTRDTIIRIKCSFPFRDYVRRLHNRKV